MEAYINYITTVAADPTSLWRPVHSASCRASSLEETIAPDLPGFLGTGRSASAIMRRTQIQHDVYGSVVLAATQMFVDERLPQNGRRGAVSRLEPLGERALELALEPDAGIWEYRGRERSPHLFRDAVLGGLRPAGADRRRLGIADRADYWATNAEAPARAHPEASLERRARAR